MRVEREEGREETAVLKRSPKHREVREGGSLSIVPLKPVLGPIIFMSCLLDCPLLINRYEG